MLHTHLIGLFEQDPTPEAVVVRWMEQQRTSFRVFSTFQPGIVFAPLDV